MSAGNLAFYGGTKSISKPLRRYNSIDDNEVSAVLDVIKSGVLSAYVASWGEDFLGGPQVQALEAETQELFKVKHAIAVNSWTSGLICAVGALSVSPGDEIIVTPWTMSATVAAILHWGCIPVFVDIDEDTFMLKPDDVSAAVSDKTKAILTADIFGQSDNYTLLRKVAEDYGLKVISDTAQAPYANTPDGFAGTLSDIGGISLNYHKHIHCGEGGIIFTDDDDLALRMRLIRNHAESCVEASGSKDLSNMIGYNFRLGELESAIARQQLKKLPNIVSRRMHIATRLRETFSKYKGLNVPKPVSNHEHVYYVFPIVMDERNFSVTREQLISFLEAEGIEGMMGGYVNCHLLPNLQNKIAYGVYGFPWNLNPDRNYTYGKGTCPNAERLHEKTFLGFEMCMLELEDDDLNMLIKGFEKVLDFCSKMDG